MTQMTRQHLGVMEYSEAEFVLQPPRSEKQCFERRRLKSNGSNDLYSANEAVFLCAD